MSKIYFFWPFMSKIYFFWPFMSCNHLTIPAQSTTSILSKSFEKQKIIFSISKQYSYESTVRKPLNSV